MDLSDITHQRRFALIPPDTSLCAGDEQAVRIRTGNIHPGTPLDRSNNSSSFPSSHYSPKRGQPHGLKRKASTTAEEYQQTNPLCEDPTTELPNKGEGKDHAKQLSLDNLTRQASPKISNNQKPAWKGWHEKQQGYLCVDCLAE